MAFDDKTRNEVFNGTTARRRNQLSMMVSAQVPKSEAGLQNELEIAFYDDLLSEALKVQAKYGIWPVFEMEELEWDDIPDIYNEPID